MNDTIFDLKNLKDLPDDVVRKLSFNATTKIIILNFFRLKPTLSIDEIIVAFYRTKKLKKSRQNIANIMYSLKNQKFVSRIKNGVYKLNDE